MLEINTLFILGVILLVYTVVWLPRPTTEFYATRGEMNAWRGGIEAELRKASAAWAAWPTGGSVVRQHDFPWHRLRRLVLISPESADLAPLAEDIGFDACTLKRDTIETTKRAQKANVQVYWHNTSFPPMVIANPEARWRAWARIETLQDRTLFVANYVVHKWRRPEHFAQICRQYERLITESHEAPTGLR